MPEVHGEVHEREPDYRFTLANERTLLAYLRTALALDAAGLAVVQFLTNVSNSAARRSVAVLLALTGLVAAVGGYRRWQANQRAMRLGASLPSSRLPLVLGLAVAAVSLVGLVIVLFG